MSGLRSGLVSLLAGVVVAGMVSLPPAMGTGAGPTGSAAVAAVGASAGQPSVVVPSAKKKKQRPSVVFASSLKLVVDVNPDLRGSRYWKVKLQRKSGNTWRTVGIYRTRGTTETRAFGVKSGTYRVKVYARPGYRSVTTPAYRFTPTPPITPVPPVPPDTTAPGVVTGVVVVGRTATSLTLAWANPADPDLAAVVVRRAVGGTAPATPGDGVAVALPTPTASSVTDTGLAVDTGYAYAVFTRDATGNTSVGVPLVTRTLGPAVMATTRVSVRADGGQASGGDSFDPAISADGRWIAFQAEGYDLVDGDDDGASDVFLHDRDTGLTQGVSTVRSDGQFRASSGGAAISADGRWITYSSVASDLVDNDTNGDTDVFLYDRDTGLTRLVSVRSDGGQATSSSRDAAISADGRWITYYSEAANLVDDDTNAAEDVFLHDRDTGLTRRVSVRSDGGQATGQSLDPAISADGRWITYHSYADNLVDDDANTSADVFLFDRDTGMTRRVSVRSNGGQATGGSYVPAISADGRWITYTSNAPNLVDDDTNAAEDVFLYDRDTGRTRRVSVRSDGSQAAGTAYSANPAISADGRWITYSASAPDLVDNDTNHYLDVFLTRMW